MASAETSTPQGTLRESIKQLRAERERLEDQRDEIDQQLEEVDDRIDELEEQLAAFDGDTEVRWLAYSSGRRRDLVNDAIEDNDTPATSAHEGAPVEEIVDELYEEHGAPPEDVHDIIETMRKRGAVYSPSPNAERDHIRKT